MTRWAAVLPLAILAGACSGLPTQPSLPPTLLVVPLQSGLWETIADPTPFPLANNSSQHLVFQFPETGSMHYLYTASSLAAIRGTVMVSVRVTASAATVFNSLDSSNCGIPPSVRPFLWANENGNGSYDRWWSNPRSFTLAAGSATIEVPLTPESWSSVNGMNGNTDSATRYAFATALLNVSRLGVTFGGGCSFGHGINVQGGRAEFALTEYAIR